MQLWLVKIIFCQCCWKSSLIFIVLMAIISALSDLARNIIKALGTLCCKDVVISKSSLKHFTLTLKKNGIKWSKEKPSYKVTVNAVFVNPIKWIFRNPRGIYNDKSQCQNSSYRISKILKVLPRGKTGIHLYYIEYLLGNVSINTAEHCWQGGRRKRPSL